MSHERRKTMVHFDSKYIVFFFQKSLTNSQKFTDRFFFLMKSLEIRVKHVFLEAQSWTFFFSQKACLRLLKTECFFRLTPKKVTAKFVSSLKMLRGTQHETRDGQFTKLPIRCQKGEIFPDS